IAAPPFWDLIPAQLGALPLAGDWNSLTSGSVTVMPLASRSEEHTSELQSRRDLVCRLLLEKKNNAALHQRPSQQHAGLVPAAFWRQDRLRQRLPQPVPPRRMHGLADAMGFTHPVVQPVD